MNMNLQERDLQEEEGEDSGFEDSSEPDSHSEVEDVAKAKEGFLS